jgi:ubiquinone/menaquinone biosynthesis C-methylase UbiE
MSEQKQSSFMQELDQWTKTTVIDPLVDSVIEAQEGPYRQVVEQVEKAIRQKVLESYRNGQKAGLPKGGRYGR